MRDRSVRFHGARYASRMLGSLWLAVHNQWLLLLECRHGQPSPEFG